MTHLAIKRRNAHGTVRIIGGRWKRTPLPVGDAPGLRPTPDRVRETVFNWLAHALGDFAGRSFLDLYAGSGALGFEAASRGAASVVLVEHHPGTAASLREVQARLAASAVQIEAVDATQAVRHMRAADRAFDVVFVDPPFGQRMLNTALPLAVGVCRPDGYIYVESDARLPDDDLSLHGLEIYRTDRAGEVFYHLLQRKKQLHEETT